MPCWTEQADLTNQNSFGFQVKAERYYQIHQSSELESALKDIELQQMPVLILGEGSNLILGKNIAGAVISIANKGINILADNGEQVIVEIAAGENWHQASLRLLEMGLHGLENLAFIPGTMGAAPIQNIGAYGVELSDCLHSLIVFDRQQSELVQLTAKDCEFGYRNSIFKSSQQGRYIIWQVRLLLNTKFTPILSYQGLERYLTQQQIQQPSAEQVHKAIGEIRQQKLPNPIQLGNAGSFFENPIISSEQHKQLLLSYPELVSYQETEDSYKLAAGWLIEQAGWKGYREGDAAVYTEQALVLVNYGNASAKQILQLADKIKHSVSQKFGIELKIEPRIYSV